MDLYISKDEELGLRVIPVDGVFLGGITQQESDQIITALHDNCGKCEGCSIGRGARFKHKLGRRVGYGAVMGETGQVLATPNEQVRYRRCKQPGFQFSIER